MVTVYQDQSGNTMRLMDGNITMLARAPQKNHGWNVCELADSGCPKALDPKAFEKYCSRGDDSCGDANSIAMNMLITGYNPFSERAPICESLMAGIQQSYACVPALQRKTAATLAAKAGIFQGELIDAN
jgi:hypothetical protein